MAEHKRLGGVGDELDGTRLWTGRWGIGGAVERRDERMETATTCQVERHNPLRIG